MAVILPAYNEASVINQVVMDLFQTLKRHSIQHRVIVVDDRSRDRTAEEALDGGAHVTFQSPESLKEIVEQIGFVVVKSTSFPFPRFIGRIFTCNEFVVVAPRS